jgi:hypothetical protein
MLDGRGAAHVDGVPALFIALQRLGVLGRARNSFASAAGVLSRGAKKFRGDAKNEKNFTVNLSFLPLRYSSLFFFKIIRPHFFCINGNSRHSMTLRAASCLSLVKKYYSPDSGDPPSSSVSKKKIFFEEFSPFVGASCKPLL